MPIKQCLPILLLIVPGSLLVSQSLTTSLSNVLRYGNGNRSVGTIKQQFSYFENLTDLRLNVDRTVTIGLRLLDDDPPEVGDRFQGVQRRFVEVRQNDFSLTAGNFSELFGRGLAMNLFENRGLAYDTWMDGVKASYHSSALQATVLGGTIDYRDSVVTAVHERYTVRGANIETIPIEGITIGTSYIDSRGKLPNGSVTKTNHGEIPEFYAIYSQKGYNGFLGYAHSWIDVIEDSRSSQGSGVYASLSYAGKGFGIITDYKDYRFDIRDPIDRLDYTRATKMLPFQNPPTVQKEQTYTLLTRAIHQVDFNDEVGLQLEGFYLLSPDVTININGSIASRHHYYYFHAGTFSFVQRKRENSFIPSLEKSLSPYWEAFADIEYYFEETSAIRGGIAQRDNLLYNDFSGPAFSHRQRETIVPLQLQYALGEIYSIIVQSENDFGYDSYHVSRQHYYTQLAVVTFNRSPDVSLSFRYEYTTDETDPTSRHDWFVSEMGYTFGKTHTVSFSVGRERGGQVCSNGVCLYRLPFSGVRFSLQSQL